jgi:hypothetical protein
MELRQVQARQCCSIRLRVPVSIACLSGRYHASSSCKCDRHYDARFQPCKLRARLQDH